MHGYTKRFILRAEQPGYQGANNPFVLNGIPVDPSVGAAFVSDPSTFLFGSGQSAPFRQSVMTLDLAKIQDPHFPLMGIGIAPDSPIPYCDIWLATEAEINKHRISPGNPLLTRLDAVGQQTALVSFPQALGRDYTGIEEAVVPAVEYAKNHVVWDVVSPLMGAMTEGLTEISFSWPLRLELYYGDVQPERRHVRAGHHAMVNWTTVGSGSNLWPVDPPSDLNKANCEEFVLWACVMGRSKWSVNAFRLDNQAADDKIKIRVYGGDAFSSVGNAATESQISISQDWIAWTELDAGSFLVKPSSPGPGYANTDGALAKTRPNRYSYQWTGAPFSFVKVIIECPHTNDPSYTDYAYGVLSLDAWD